MADLPKPSDLLKKGLPKPQDLLEKKNAIQNGSKTISEPLPFGSKPFQTQVDTKVPSVLTAKGGEEYKEQKKTLSDQLQKAQKAFASYQGEGLAEEIASIPKREVSGIRLPKEKVQKEEAKGGGGTAFMADLNRFNEGIFKTPRFVYDAASTITDAALQALNLTEKESTYDEFLQASGLSSPLSVLDRVGDYYSGQANQYEKRQEKFDKDIINSLSSGNYSDAGKQLWNNIAGSIPSMVGMAVSGGAGNVAKLKYIQSTALTALPFASRKNSELMKDESIPKYVRVGNSVLNSVAEVVFDQSFGTTAMIRGIVNVFKNQGRDAAVDATNKIIKGFAEQSIKKIQPFTGALKGSVEEMSTTLSQNIVDKYTIDPERDLTQGVLDAGLVGGVMTGGFGALGSVAYSSSQKKRVAQLMKQREELVDDIDNDNLPDEVKIDLSDKLSKLDDDITNIDNVSEILISNLPSEDKVLLKENQDKIVSIEKALEDDSLSETAKQALTENLSNQQEKVNQILDKAAKLPIEPIAAQPTQEDVLITPETSSNYANMTEDDKGNFVFFHVGAKGYDKIKPGTGASTVTSREEAAALSKVGGLGMYYTDPNQVERQSAEGAKYAVKIPKEKVYDFNTDKLNFIEEAKARHEAENPGKAFDINSQLAYVTKIAGENGFDMVVAQWNNMTRAQTTKELTPTDIQESEGNVIKKAFNEQYESNKKKGFEPVVPVAKSERLATLYDKINKIRNKEKRYDDLYRLYADSNKLEQDSITELINESDLPQEIKDEYRDILESKEETRRSQQTKPKEDAVQKQGLQKSIKSTTFVDEEIKPNLIPEGSQKELRVDSKTIRNFKEKDTVERNNSSIQTWLESISRNDKKEKRNEGEELFGESVFSKESQAGVLLDDIYRKWQSLRAQTPDESKVGQDIGTARTRTSLEQQRVGQQNRELAIIDELRAQEASQQDSEQGNISENSRKKQVEAGRMVEKILELSSLPNDPKKASVARALRDLLSSSTQKEKELIINEIKNKLYAVSKSISSKVPVLTEAPTGKKVEQGKPESETKVVTEEGGKAVGKTVKVKNAPTGNHLNIGLYEGRTKKKMSGKGVLSKLPKDVKVISSSEIKGTEPTLVVETSRPLTDAEMIKLLGDTKQQAIPQLSNGEGILYDTERGTKNGWGEFSPELFLLQDGKVLSEYKKTEGPELNESNVENAIELLDDIEDNRRKSERASSKRKAELDEKIAKAETELYKISDEAQIVKAINDNFDKIKKDLKEQGLLNVKC